jgi:hypothetical protein
MEANKEDVGLVKSILAWADDHPRFDASFVEDVHEKLLKYGHLTEGQRTALERIVETWHIDLEEY